MLRTKKRLLTEKYIQKEDKHKINNVERIIDAVDTNKYVQHYETRQIYKLIKKFIEDSCDDEFEKNYEKFKQMNLMTCFARDAYVRREVYKKLKNTKEIEYFIIENLPPKVILVNLFVNIQLIEDENRESVVKIIVSFCLKNRMDSFLFKMTAQQGRDSEIISLSNYKDL